MRKLTAVQFSALVVVVSEDPALRNLTHITERNWHTNEKVLMAMWSQESAELPHGMDPIADVISASAESTLWTNVVEHYHGVMAYVRPSDSRS